MSARIALAAMALSVAASGSAQQLRTYTQSQVGPSFLTYGLPVPEPVESLTPVDGFRSYASLEARLQSLALASPDLRAHDVGPTLQGRALWAYVVSDENGVDVEGRAEAAFFINAATHAREWAAPEVSTGTVERLVELADDGGINRYLLDNTRLVIIPVHNVDGLLQTQRFPTQVLVGLDPDFPNDWPRDGRMRRKNMRGVDEVLTTLGDHLNGVDLNRNHPPFWATTTSSSTNPSSLLFHGGGAHSEPESQALLRAAELGPVTRIRLGIDVHSHSAVYFSVNTARSRLNNIQNRLIGNLIGHHAQAAGRPYTNVPEPPNRGIGTAAEYFGYQWLVPSWTLELEPSESVSEYGGTNVTHGGFILPASQARRVREGWAQTHAIAFYMMAGPPHLARLRVVDVGTGVIALESRWVYNPASGLRERMTTVPGPLIPSRRYRAELGFSKPMRYREPGGAVARLPGRELSDIEVGAALLRGTTTLPLDTAAGQWLTDPARTLRYRDDTFAFEFNAPAETGDVRFEFDVADMTGLPLDADPASPADWASGAWSEYENANGADGDFGGADRTMAVAVSPQAAVQVSVQADVSIVGEGDRVRIRATRAAGTGRLELRRLDRTPPQTLATWEAGETGVREFLLQTNENLSVDGDRPEHFLLSEVVDGVSAGATSIALPVLDNDVAGRRVWNLPRAESLQAAWNEVSASATPVDLVLHSDGNYAVALDAVGAVPGGLAEVATDLVVFGNHGRISVSGVDPGRSNLVQIAVGNSLQIDDVDLRVIEPQSAATVNAEAIIDNAGSLRITRSSLEVMDAGRLLGPLLRNRGALLIERSGLSARTDLGDGSIAVPLLQQVTGTTAVIGSTLHAGSFERRTPLAVDLVAGTMSLSSVTLAGGVPAARVPIGNPVRIISSLVLEARGGFAPPTFVRETCPSPLFAGEGSNFFAPSYAGGDSNGFLTAGCVTLHPTDVLRDSSVLFGPDVPGEPMVRFEPTEALIDVGAPTNCANVDQRGAPRPQSSTASTPVRCDVGAVEIGVNPYRGIWAPERSGHGMELELAGNRLLLVWYTYGDDGQPTVYQAVAPLTGPNWSATLQRSARNVQTGAVTLSNVGTVGIDFDNDVVATLRWRFAARGIDGSERIRASLFGTGEPRVEVTGLWYPPEDSGYGATIGRRGETTAAAIYYYDALGNIRWALGSGNGNDAIEFSMASFTGFCPDCNASANPPVGTAAGRLMVHFLTPRRARMDMELTYPRGVGGTWNRDRASFVPLSDPVDNREAVAQFPR